MARLSKIVDEFGKPFVVDRQPKLSSKYDAAQTSDENRRHWAQADALGARAANSPGVRRTLRNRSRYERDNDPIYGGLVRTIPGDMIGTGPTLQCRLDNDKINHSIEQKYGEWVDAIGFVTNLLIAGETKIVDGEPFGIIRTADIPGEPVPLDVQWVEPEQCATPGMAMPKDITRWVDGIDLDERGKPLRYHILREHPGDGLTLTQDFEKVPADQVLHWFRRSRHGQYRGIPECTAGLPIGAQRRRWAMATLTAAELAADFAVLVTSNLPPGYEEEDLPAPFETLEIDRGMITTLPAGGDAKQMRSEHPGEQYVSFKHEQLKEMGRPVGAPYSVVGLDGSEHNYSSLRYEREIYHSALTVERDGCRRAVLDRVFRAWYAIARLIPGYLAPSQDDLPEKIAFGWYWPGFAAIDPLKEAAADTERLTNGTTTLQEIFAGYGQDYITFLKQRSREITMMRELGLPLPKWADPAAGTSAAVGGQNQNQNQPQDDQNAQLRLALLTDREAS